MRLSESLLALAADRGEPMRRAYYAEDLPSAVGKRQVRLRIDADEGPFIVTELLVPGATTYPAAAQVEIQQGGRLYTDGPVRVSALDAVAGNQAPAASAAAVARALATQSSLPAPIVVDRGGQLLVDVELDAGTFGAAAFVRFGGFHCSEELAALVASLGEFYAANLSLSFTAAVTADKDEHEFASSVSIARIWCEEDATGGGALTQLRLRVGDVDLIKSPEHGRGILAPYPADPRSVVGLLVDPAQRLTFGGNADGAGTLTERLIVVGSRVYRSEG